MKRTEATDINSLGDILSSICVAVQFMLEMKVVVLSGVVSGCLKGLQLPSNELLVAAVSVANVGMVIA